MRAGEPGNRGHEMNRRAALIDAIAVEQPLLERFVMLNQKYRELLGTEERRSALSATQRTEQAAKLRALAQDARVLGEELQSVHRAYMDTYGPQAGKPATAGKGS